MKIPYFKPWISSEDKKSVLDTLNQRWLTNGPKLKKFENVRNYKFEKYLDLTKIKRKKYLDENGNMITSYTLRKGKFV